MGAPVRGSKKPPCSGMDEDASRNRARLSRFGSDDFYKSSHAPCSRGYSSIGLGEWSCSTWQCFTPASAATSMIGSIGITPSPSSSNASSGSNRNWAFRSTCSNPLSATAIRGLLIANQFDRVLAANLDPEDIDLEVHVRRELFDHHLVTSLSALHRLEFEGVIVIRQLDAGLLRLLGRFVASLA